MISYREKQLLMVQKMLSDDAALLAEEMMQNIELMQQNQLIPLTEYDSRNYERDIAGSYDDLTDIAAACGYNTYIRVEDILSPDELAEIDLRQEEIEQQFKEKVKLSKPDIVFLFSAVLLQIIKQLYLKLDLEKPEGKANEEDTEYKSKYKGEIDENEKVKRYYAPGTQIRNTSFVPYDIVKNTKNYDYGKETGLGLNGNNHRYKTPGHDPLLGLIFGTANILTNTATFYIGKKAIRTVHVKFKNPETFKGPYIGTKATTALMFEKAMERIGDTPADVRDAFRKQIEHIHSDEDSIAGIPIPFLSYILGPDTAEQLAKNLNLNYAQIKKNLAVVGKQAAVSEYINGMITVLHRIYLLWDDVKKEKDWKQKVMLLLRGELDSFQTVRSKKIILYSNLIASSLNLAVCVGGGAASSIFLKDINKSKKFFSHCDFGGYVVTLRHLFTDGRFILKVKNDFVLACAQKDFEEKLEHIRDELEENKVEGEC